MVNLQVTGGEDFEPMELRVTGRTLTELQPFLRMAERTGVPVRLVPTAHEHLPNSCTLHVNLAYLRDLDGLVTFLLASVALASGPKRVDAMRHNAQKLALQVNEEPV